MGATYVCNDQFLGNKSSLFLSEKIRTKENLYVHKHIRGQFWVYVSPFTMWVLGLELSVSGLVASAFIC